MELGLGEGLLQRQKAAENVVHLAATAETEDHQDHTFAGIMWDVRTRKLPAEYIEISSVWLRGDLGPITVWSTPNTYQGKHQKEDEWKCHYKQVHQPSPHVLQEMRLDEPLRLEPGESCGMYAHSAMPGDEQIVYDNHRQSHQFSYRDLYIDILPGMAHLSDVPFSSEHQFMGWWGRPWRERREFVGRLSYGVRWLLWNPDVHARMPAMFKQMVWSILMSRSERANGSFLHYLEPDMLFYILNKVEWWESPAIMGELKKESEEVATPQPDYDDRIAVMRMPGLGSCIGIAGFHDFVYGHAAEDEEYSMYDEEDEDEDEGEGAACEEGEEDDDDDDDDDDDEDEGEEEAAAATPAAACGAVAQCPASEESLEDE